MDIKLVVGSSLMLAVLLSLHEGTNAIDPYYIPKAKILSREEVMRPEPGRFAPSARKCKNIGERAAKQSLSCVADGNFYESMLNRVHMSRTVYGRSMSEMKALAYRISKCSHKYAKYYEKACSMKSTYLNDRRRCRRLGTMRARTECKGEIRRRYFG